MNSIQEIHTPRHIRDTLNYFADEHIKTQVQIRGWVHEVSMKKLVEAVDELLSEFEKGRGETCHVETLVQLLSLSYPNAEATKVYRGIWAFPVLNNEDGTPDRINQMKWSHRSAEISVCIPVRNWDLTDKMYRNLQSKASDNDKRKLRYLIQRNVLVPT